MNLLKINQKYKFTLFLLIIFFTVIKYYLDLVGELSLYMSLLLFVILLLNLTPIYNYLISYKEKDHIPLFELSHIYFFFCYSLPIIFHEHRYLSNFLKKTNDLDLIYCLKIYLLGLLFFNLGYFLFKKNTNPKKNKIFEIDKKYNGLLFIGIISYLLVVITFYLFDDQLLVKKIFQLKFPILYLSLGFLFLYIILKKNFNFFGKLTLFILILIPIYLETLTGSLLSPMLILIYLYLLSFIYTKKLYLKYLSVFFLIFFFLHTFKNELRNELWWSKKDINEPIVYVFYKSYSDAIKKHSNLNFEEYKYLIINRNFGRLYHSFDSLIIVTRKSPNIIPYWNGYSYKILTSKIVPRIFWKNKPSDTLGNQFARRYEMITDPTDKHTSWNMPVLNEFYANFGIKGVMIGMLFVGIIFSLINKFLNFSKHNLLYIITFISTYPIFVMESHLSMLYGAIFQTFIFLVIFTYVLLKLLAFIKSRL